MKRGGTTLWDDSLPEEKQRGADRGCRLDGSPLSQRLSSTARKKPPSAVTLASAQAACIALMLSAVPVTGGDTPTRVTVAADITLDSIHVNGWMITGSHCVLTAAISKKRMTLPEISAEAAQQEFLK